MRQQFKCEKWIHPMTDHNTAHERAIEVAHEYSNDCWGGTKTVVEKIEGIVGAYLRVMAEDPEPHKLMPREPDEAMREGVSNVLENHTHLNETYRQMWDAHQPQDESSYRSRYKADLMKHYPVEPESAPGEDHLAIPDPETHDTEGLSYISPSQGAGPSDPVSDRSAIMCLHLADLLFILGEQFTYHIDHMGEQRLSPAWFDQCQRIVEQRFEAAGESRDLVAPDQNAGAKCSSSTEEAAPTPAREAWRACVAAQGTTWDVFGPNRRRIALACTETDAQQIADDHNTRGELERELDELRESSTDKALAWDTLQKRHKKYAKLQARAEKLEDIVTIAKRVRAEWDNYTEDVTTGNVVALFEALDALPITDGKRVAPEGR